MGEEPSSLSYGGPIPDFQTPFQAYILESNPFLGPLTQIEPTLHYPPVEPMPGVTAGILVCASSAHHPCLTTCQLGLLPMAWAMVRTLGELASHSEPDRCNC